MKNNNLNPRLLASAAMRRCSLEECRAACCLNGAWVDTLEMQDILDNRDQIRPHMLVSQNDPLQWFDDRQEDDPHSLSGKVGHTTVLPNTAHYGDRACIFLRQDFRCALQVAAQTAGEHPWRYKPFYCVLHPLDLDEAGYLTLDEDEALLSEPASCLRPAQANTPLLETFEPELRYLLGEKQYRHFWEQVRGTPP
jgi:hypothetical protein